MMNNLTKRQKKLLDEWYNENKSILQKGLIFFDWSECQWFPVELYDKLEEINDTEILSDLINNYIREKD